MLENILSLKGASVLDKEKQSKIMGGVKTDCAIYRHFKHGTEGWSTQVYTSYEARCYYDTNGEWIADNFRVTLYCCGRQCESMMQGTDVFDDDPWSN